MLLNQACLKVLVILEDPPPVEHGNPCANCELKLKIFQYIIRSIGFISDYAEYYHKSFQRHRHHSQVWTCSLRSHVIVGRLPFKTGKVGWYAI